MKIEEQVTSLELSKKLKELGVKQESLYYWKKQRPWDDYKVSQDVYREYDYCSAYRC